MNDDDPAGLWSSSRPNTATRRADPVLSSEPTGDQIEVARLKRRKLMLKDQIQRIIDSNVPDIIA